MQKLFNFLFFIALIYPYNHTYGMEKENESKLHISLMPESSDFTGLELSYFRCVPKEIIEKIAADSRKKNNLMLVGRLFSKICSLNNLLKCNSLVLHPSDGQSLINRYVRENNIDMVKNLLEKGAPCPCGIDACDMSKEMYDLLETFGMSYKVIDLFDEIIKEIFWCCGSDGKDMFIKVNKRFNKLFSKNNRINIINKYHLWL